MEGVRQEQTAREEQEARQAAWEKERREREKAYRQSAPRRSTTASRPRTTRARRSSSRQTPLEKAINSTANPGGRELGKQIVRGLFGTFHR